MGVPALFRWLSSKYPKIVSQVAEEKAREVDGEVIPVDTTQPNPNGEEFDNLYLDMNGIVHPCSHPEDKAPPSNEEEMMLEIFKYTDRVINMVRPRKLLMIAVDGVAPRAKMNQQRSRRFRAAQEAKQKDEDIEEFAKILKSQNYGVVSESVTAAVTKKTWDSNAITPGTPFMDILAASLRYWSAYKINTDPAWEKIKVIISDATVPGEGEHKIMQFIRSQRISPEHDPNTRHVIYGLDADLIMLGLATHEPYFRVLREDVYFQEAKARTCRICGQKGHIADACKGQAAVKEGEFDEKDSALAEKPFIWLHVSILREYLMEEMYVPNQGFDFDLERALDDWIFMCFFVGNDFLPHLPSLDIRENGIDTLIGIWRDNIPLMQGYLTKDGSVDLVRAQYILDALAKQEDNIFRRRQQGEERKAAANKRRKLEDERRNEQRSTYEGAAQLYPQGGSSTQSAAQSQTNGRPKKGAQNIAPPDLPLFVPGARNPTKEERAITHEMVVNRGSSSFRANANDANKSAAAVLKEKLRGATNSSSSSSTSTTKDPSAEGPRPDAEDGSRKRKADSQTADSQPPEDEVQDPATSTGETKKVEDEETEGNPDTIRLWEPGYADRYYEQKFKVDPANIAFRNQVARDYVEGLAWVLLYYFQGCPSWTWYYPHHYAPFAADFVDIKDANIAFTKGAPFRPFEQLMGVLPAASNHAIPEVFRPLMEDEDSEIIDFYPSDFPVDLNGKKFAWQGVALLPFIDGKRLLDAMATKYPLLSAEDAARNEPGRDVVILSDKHTLYHEISAQFYSKQQGAPRLEMRRPTSDGLYGYLEKNEDYLPQSELVYPLEHGMPNLSEDHSISLPFEMLSCDQVHKSMLLRGVKMPTTVLNEADRQEIRAKAGGRPGRGYNGNNYQYQNRQNGPHRNSGNFNSQRPYPSQGDGIPINSHFAPRHAPYPSHHHPHYYPTPAPQAYPAPSHSQYPQYNAPQMYYPPAPGQYHGQYPQHVPQHQPYQQGNSYNYHQPQYPGQPYSIRPPQSVNGRGGYNSGGFSQPNPRQQQYPAYRR